MKKDRLLGCAVTFRRMGNDQDQISGRRSDTKLPKWHKQLIDTRLDALEKNPELIRPISELLDELG